MSKTANSVINTAGQVAKSINTFLEAAPHQANLLCILGGILITINGVFGVMDIGTLASAPMVYIMNAYSILFGLVTVVSEARPEFAPFAHEHLERWQAFLHEWALVLKELWGRGLFYLFQGTLALSSCQSLFSLGIIAGPCMMILGVYFLCLYKDRRQAVEAPIQHPAIDDIRCGTATGRRRSRW